MWGWRRKVWEQGTAEVEEEGGLWGWEDLELEGSLIGRVLPGGQACGELFVSCYGRGGS